MKKGSTDRSCQHPWFSEFDFIHDIGSESLFATHVTGIRIDLGIDASILPEKIGKQKQRAGIIGANSSKIHLFSCNSEANEK